MTSCYIVYGKPTNQFVTQLELQRSKRTVAEECAGRKLGVLTDSQFSTLTRLMRHSQHAD